MGHQLRIYKLRDQHHHESNYRIFTHESLIRKCKKKHEENIQKAKEKIQLELEKTQRRLENSIVRRHPVHKIGDCLEILNNRKRNKLEQSWKGPYEIIE